VAILRLADSSGSKHQFACAPARSRRKAPARAAHLEVWRAVAFAVATPLLRPLIVIDTLTSAPRSPEGCAASVQPSDDCGCTIDAPRAGGQLSYSLGLPHLGAAGLGEEWFLREAGHRHWLGLERLMGIEAQHWVSERGDPLYATFVAARLRGPLFAMARLGDGVTWYSTTPRHAAHVMVSSHTLHRQGDGAIARVLLASTFVARTNSGNHRFARHGMRGALPPVPTTSQVGACITSLLEARRHSRSLAPDEQPCDHRLTIVPGEDFNAAGMVYFATMPRLLDRGEWYRVAAQDPNRRRSPLRPLIQRELFWYGNADAGDAVRVRHAGDERIGVSALTRDDGTLICIARTHRT
jgi:probable biosynthetic protein (TIGR04098 family)